MQQACLVSRQAASTTEIVPSYAYHLMLECLLDRLLYADKDIHDLGNQFPLGKICNTWCVRRKHASAYHRTRTSQLREWRLKLPVQLSTKCMPSDTDPNSRSEMPSLCLLLHFAPCRIIRNTRIALACLLQQHLGTSQSHRECFSVRFEPSSIFTEVSSFLMRFFCWS